MVRRCAVSGSSENSNGLTNVSYVPRARFISH